MVPANHIYQDTQPKLLLPHNNIPQLNFKFKKDEINETRNGKKVKIITRTYEPELNKLFQYIPNTEQVQVQPEIVYEAIDYIIDEFQQKYTRVLDILDLYLGTDWVWKTNLGTLPKRISKWYHTHTKDDLSDQTLTRLGNLFRKHVPKVKKYLLDLTKTFDWTDGDFADGGSCFWGGNARARYKMQDTPGYYAIRFFKERSNEISFTNKLTDNTRYITKNGIKGWYPYSIREDNYLKYYKTYGGLSRAWLFVDTWEKEVHKGVIVRSPIFIIFNGYGIQTNIIASIFAEALSLPVRRLEIKNQNVYNNYLYVNDVGWLIGDPVITDGVEVFDFDLKFN